MRKTIVAVEESGDVGQLIDYVLSNAGYAVRRVDTAQQALEVIRNDPPHAVLADLDLQTPTLDGLGFIAEVRNLPCGAGIPILALSAERPEAERARAAGAVGWIAKPFCPERLISTVRHVTG